MRGEYFTAFTQSGSCRELPPRARRIPTRENLIQQNRGTTSACAENTGGCLVLILHDGNYLRVRGEYRSKHVTRTHVVELPPRARRIHCVRESIRVKTGTTSACAENTGRYSCWSSRIRNYLRVRGEYPISRNRKGSLSELPPRARRIQISAGDAADLQGTTSACAENTSVVQQNAPSPENYLRVRGEYSMPRGRGSRHQELPPRARRILVEQSWRDCCLGTTSACAENTPFSSAPPKPSGNYLRVRGEYPRGLGQDQGNGELPPRARRIRLVR